MLRLSDSSTRLKELKRSSRLSLRMPMPVSSFIAPDARILVVDDNSMNLMVVVKLLRDTKVKVDMAELMGFAR